MYVCTSIHKITREGEGRVRFPEKVMSHYKQYKLLT